jgi:hypothetical protein
MRNLTEGQRVAWGALKFLGWCVFGFGLVMGLLWLPNILM